MYFTFILILFYSLHLFICLVFFFSLFAHTQAVHHVITIKMHFFWCCFEMSMNMFTNWQLGFIGWGKKTIKWKKKKKYGEKLELCLSRLVCGVKAIYQVFLLIKSWEYFVCLYFFLLLKKEQPYSIDMQANVSNKIIIIKEEESEREIEDFPTKMIA